MGLPTAALMGTALLMMEPALCETTWNQICARRWQPCAADRGLESWCW